MDLERSSIPSHEIGRASTSVTAPPSPATPHILANAECPFFSKADVEHVDRHVRDVLKVAIPWLGFDRQLSILRGHTGSSPETGRWPVGDRAKGANTTMYNGVPFFWEVKMAKMPLVH